MTFDGGTTAIVGARVVVGNGTVLEKASILVHDGLIESIGPDLHVAPGTEIVGLTMEESPVFAQQALDAGAIGFVLKDMSDEELPERPRL